MSVRYDINKVCVCVRACLCVQWKISVPEGERVRLTFTSFDLAPELCGDYVEVFDGHKAGAAKLGRQVQTSDSNLVQCTTE